MQGSTLRLVDDCNINFESNYATNTGGVFYIGTNLNVYVSGTFSNRTCFLNVMGDRSHVYLSYKITQQELGEIYCMEDKLHLLWMEK